MSKIAILLPYKNMKETVKKVLDEKDYKIDYIKVISTENAVNEAMLAVEQRRKMCTRHIRPKKLRS